MGTFNDLTLGNLLAKSALAMKQGKLDLFIADKHPFIVDEVADVADDGQPECAYCGKVMSEPGFCSKECEESWDERERREA